MLTTVLATGSDDQSAGIARKTCTSSDGVTIVYSIAGAGSTALLFIHGGMADRTFYDEQLRSLSSRYRVVSIDLAGHGESGTNRKTWSFPQFGADVKAVVDAEEISRVILFGNSAGGPVAVEAALQLPGRALGVVGIDTFQDLAAPSSGTSAEAREQMRARAEAFRKDYEGSMKAMVKRLFHADADPKLVAETERRMLRTRPEVADALLSSFTDYDYSQSVRKLTVPLRTINGDLYPTDVAAIRKITPDFDAIVMPHMGHYPMLERPAEFDRHVLAVAEALDRK